MASPEPFQPYRQVQGKAERDLARILEATAKRIQRRIERLPIGVGGTVRAAQLRVVLAEIRRLQRLMWRNQLDPAIRAAVEAALEAGESAVEALTAVAYSALSPDVAEALVDGLRLTAQSGLRSDAARRKRALSSRVWNQQALHEGKVEDLIRQGLISGLSAKELAKDVYEHVSPSTPGGASYAAMRLARTEINNAFHERQLEGANRPGVTAVKWNLSGSHKVPDECNVYAAKGGNGHWPKDGVPEKPHPQCFCYLTYVTMEPGKFAEAFQRGDFDSEIERRTREKLARLREQSPPPAVKSSGPSKADVQTASNTLGLPENEARDFLVSTKADPNNFLELVKAWKVYQSKTAPVSPVKPTRKRTATPAPRRTATGTTDSDSSIFGKVWKRVDSAIPAPTRERVRTVLKRQEELVGSRIDRVKGITNGISDEMKVRGSGDIVAHAMCEGGHIYLHHDLHNMEERLNKSRKNGNWFVKGGHSHGESVIAHEVGHALADASVFTGAVRGTAFREVGEALGLDMSTFPGLLAPTVRLSRWIMEENNQRVIKQKVGEYAARNSHELIAEIWSAYAVNDPSLPGYLRRAGEALQRAFMKGKK